MSYLQFHNLSKTSHNFLEFVLVRSNHKHALLLPPFPFCSPDLGEKAGPVYVFTLIQCLLCFCHNQSHCDDQLFYGNTRHHDPSGLLKRLKNAENLNLMSPGPTNGVLMYHSLLAISVTILYMQQELIVCPVNLAECVLKLEGGMR